MSKSQLLGYLSAGAGLGVIYLIFKQLCQGREKIPKKTVEQLLTIEMTRKIALEIKYQMLSVCILFANKVDKQLRTTLSSAQLQKATGVLRQNLALIYQQKQAIILGKYKVEKEVYGQSLSHYEQDDELIRIRESIMEMLQSAVQGNLPDLSVPQEAFDYLSNQELVNTYRDLSETILVKVWKKIMEFIANDPSFNVKNDEHFTKVIRQVSVYDVRVNFLLEKGYKPQWGCPNQTFFKVIEAKKIENKQFSEKITQIEKSYERIVELISHTPQETSEQDLRQRFYSEIHRYQQLHEMDKINVGQI